jgi:hypothetical protein
MKIIGETNCGFIVEMSVSEAEYLAGGQGKLKTNEGYECFCNVRKYDNIEFNIGECWDRVMALKQNAEGLRGIRNQLCAIAASLEPIQMVVEKLTNAPVEK